MSRIHPGPQQRQPNRGLSFREREMKYALAYIGFFLFLFSENASALVLTVTVPFKDSFVAIDNVVNDADPREGVILVSNQFGDFDLNIIGGIRKIQANGMPTLVLDSVNITTDQNISNYNLLDIALSDNNFSFSPNHLQSGAAFGLLSSTSIEGFTDSIGGGVYSVSYIDNHNNLFGEQQVIGNLGWSGGIMSKSIESNINVFSGQAFSMTIYAQVDHRALGDASKFTITSSVVPLPASSILLISALSYVTLMRYRSIE